MSHQLVGVSMIRSQDVLMREEVYMWFFGPYKGFQ